MDSEPIDCEKTIEELRDQLNEANEKYEKLRDKYKRLLVLIDKSLKDKDSRCKRLLAFIDKSLKDEDSNE